RFWPSSSIGLMPRPKTAGGGLPHDVATALMSGDTVGNNAAPTRAMAPSTAAGPRWRRPSIPPSAVLDRRMTSQSAATGTKRHTDGIVTAIIAGVGNTAAHD